MGGGARQALRILRGAGALLRRLPQLLDRGGGAVECDHLLLGSLAQVEVAGRQLVGGEIDRPGAVAHADDQRGQTLLHPAQGLQQHRHLARSAGAGGGVGQVAPGHPVGRLQRIGQRAGHRAQRQYRQAGDGHGAHQRHQGQGGDLQAAAPVLALPALVDTLGHTLHQPGQGGLGIA